jgi:hypothetical protein
LESSIPALLMCLLRWMAPAFRRSVRLPCQPFRLDIRHALGICGLLLLPHPAYPAKSISVDASSDIDWTYDAQKNPDEKVLRLVLPSTAAAIDLGTLPVTADVTAFHWLDETYRLFSLDIPVDVTQGLVYPQNVIAWDGTTYYFAFDPEVAAIPASSGIDALSATGNGLILLSFDVTTQLPGGVVAADEDVVAWDGVGWSMFFDGSAKGIPAGLDIDGLDIHTNGSMLYFSFDTSGLLGNTYFNDEDIVAYDGANWSLSLDASAVLGVSLAAGDLDAFGLLSALLFRDGFESPPPP